jgi:lysophospholipase L1-like esterase
MKTLIAAVHCFLAACFLVSAEDARPVVDGSKVATESAANLKLPTFHIVGDSTVRSGGRDGMWGWGERIAPFFDPEKINAVNHAIGGRSARTFFNEGRWQKVADALQPGDFVIIQFGHNDQGRVGDPANKGRADLPGTGDETAADTQPDGTQETVHTFGWYLKRFVSDAQAKKATAILCSPVPHKDRWENGRDFENLAGWAKEVADSNKALYFDLTQLITDAYLKAGRGQVETFFADRNTHTTDAGARFNAECVVAGLKTLPGNPIGKFLAGNAETPARDETPARRFSFGTKEPTSGWTRVAAGDLYSAQTGYGFEPGAQGGGAEHFTSQKPFLFSVKLPEGNFAVTVIFDDAGESSATVKSETRRLMLEKVPGKATRTFIVNVRTPQIPGGTTVKLKARELESETLGWDDKLTLEFNGRRPALRALTITPAAVPTVFITGDSTVCDQPAEPWGSWGQMLPQFFGPTVAVANYAQSGESIRSSLGARRFDKVFSLMKPGDYHFIQFGHNDMKDTNPDALEIYQSNLEKLVARTRELGGTPVLITSVERKSGVRQDTLAGYPDTVREVAKKHNCALIDLHAMSRTLYQSLGPDLDKAFQDATHHNNYGSYLLAKCVIAAIQQTDLPLAKAIAPDFGDFDPAKPDPAATFEIPAIPGVSAIKPLGN